MTGCDPEGEAELLRRRLAALEAALDRLEDAELAAPRSQLCLTTTIASYPTTAGAYYAVQAQRVSGSEAEGGTPTLAAVGPKFFAYNLGSAVPPSGTKVIVDPVPDGFVFRYDG